MKTASNVTRMAIGLLVLAVPYAASASPFGQEEAKSERATKIEERQNMRQVKTDERQAARAANESDRQSERQGKFCENFTARLGEIESKLTEGKGKFVDRKKKRVEYLDEKRDTRDNALTDTREEQDARRNGWYEKLEGAADTSEKQAALSTFKSTVEAAVETRRGVVDAQMLAFRQAVDAAVSAQGENRAGGVETFEAIVAAALSQAKKDCADGKSAEDVRGAFQTSLKAARATLQSERSEGEKLGMIIKDLAQTRNAAIKAAHATFESTLAQARTDLKAAFGTEAIGGVE